MQIILKLLVCSLVIVSGGVFIRNNLVYAYRTKLISKISRKNLADIHLKNYNTDWRWELFDSISYNEMVYTFWKPLNSFYDEEAILGKS